MATKMVAAWSAVMWVKFIFGGKVFKPVLFRIIIKKIEMVGKMLRWLKTVSSTWILMGCYCHSSSLDATIMVSKSCPSIGEHVVVLFIT